MNRSEGLARWLIQHAARSAPPMLAERLEEEWLADLDARRGLVARLRLGIGCCWATRVIAHEHCGASVAATATATGSKTMTAYVHHDGTFFSRRTVTFLFIIGLHVAIIYAFATGLTHQVVRLIVDPMKYIPLQDPDVRRQPPPLPQPQLDSHPFRVDLVGPVIDEFPPVIDAIPVDTASISDLVAGPDVARTSTPRTVNRVLGGPGRGFPNTEEYYPASAIRSRQQGAAIVRTCVDERGRLTAAPTLTQSSGTAILDGGALKLAKAGSGHYRPTTEDGRPVSSCYEFRITFHMKKD